MSSKQRLDDIDLSSICKNKHDRCVFCVSYDNEKQVIRNLIDHDLHVTSSSNAFILSLKLARQYSKLKGFWGCDHNSRTMKGNLDIVDRIANLIKQNSRDIHNPSSLIQGIFSMMENPRYKELTEAFFDKIGKAFITTLDPRDFAAV